MAMRIPFRVPFQSTAVAGALLAILGPWAATASARDLAADPSLSIASQGARGNQGGAKGQHDKARSQGKQDKKGRGSQGKGQGADHGQKGAKKDHPPQAKDGQRTGERDTPRGETDRPADGTREGVRDRVTDKPSDQATGGERTGDRPTDQVQGAGEPLTDADRAQAGEIEALERSHRTRLARLERMAAIYKEQGDTEKLARVEQLRQREGKVYESKMAKHQKDLGPEKFQRVVKGIDAPNRPGQQQRQGERAKQQQQQQEGQTDRPGARQGDRPGAQQRQGEKAGKWPGPKTNKDGQSR